MSDESALAATEDLAMDEDEFWSLLDDVPALDDDPDLEALTDALAGLPGGSAGAFQARLILALFALDGPVHRDWLTEHDPDQLGFVSDEVFLSARCATVLLARETWQVAVRDEVLPWGDDPEYLGMAESLLYVAEAAATRRGEIESYRETVDAIPVSYETGSNSTLWGAGVTLDDPEDD